MTTLQMTKRGSLTIPPDVRRRLGLNGMNNALLIMDERDGGIFIQPATAVPVRDIPAETIQAWIRDDEEELKSLRADGKA